MSEMNQNKNDTCVAGVTGRVKWFNNKRGYGFITTITGGVDVFAHHSAITTTNEQFLYLVEGEYVSFGMVQTASEADAVPRWEATTITGYGGGKLMCETRNESQSERHDSYDPELRERRGRGRGRGRGQYRTPVVYVDEQYNSGQQY